ncbi:MAG: peptidylprolyl isomerase [Planctomycetota bacterium]
MITRTVQTLFLGLWLTASLTPAQAPTGANAPDTVLANYQLLGKPAAITRTDVALEMAFHLRRRDRGRDACGMMVDSLLTRTAAKKLGLMPTRADVTAFWDKLKDQLRAAGERPEKFAAVRNTGEAQWLQDLSVHLAHERLVRHELGLDKNARVSGDMLSLWLSEARENADVETDPDKLPVGTAARVDKARVPLIDLGFLLLRTSEDFERDKFIRQVIYLNSIEALAAERGITVSAADIDREIEAQRKQSKQRLGGVPYEKQLEALGLSVQALRQLRTFRAKILLAKLADNEFGDDALRDEIAANRTTVLDEVGPRRRIGMILTRGVESPNAIVDRTTEQARKHSEKVRERIVRDGFAATASVESEHGPSKKRGGDVGWHRRGGDGLPKPVLHAAFALGLAEVSVPIETELGCYLVTVLDREPMPSEDELCKRLRRQRARAWSESLLKAAKIEIVGAKTPEAGTPANAGAAKKSSR